MAEYRVEFTADSSAAERSIKNLKKEIKGVTKEFEGAEIGAAEFLEAASDLSGLQKELKDARGAVVNIDKAYQDLNKALDSMSSAYDKAGRNAENHHKKLIKLAEDSYKEEDRLLKKRLAAEEETFNRILKIREVAKKKEARQQQGIMEFRAGMGAKGAIPEVASPLRGGAAFPDSPAYIEEIAKAAKRAQQELNDAAKIAGTIAPPAQAFQPLSLAAYEAKLQVLKREARLISPGDIKWKQLNKQILQATRGIEKINKMQKLGPTAGQRAGAAGGAFLYGGGMGGGIGSAVGGIAGGLAGGVPGAFAGAAIGQVADNLGTALAGITSQAAAVQRMQRGLAMASVDARDFAEAQAAVGEISQKILMPLEQTTKFFAQLRANTREYNLSVDETREILEGTALAIMATGGSADDLGGAMRAVVQILSKGSVQAEELRGQLGERFPGAVVRFAKANKLSFEELQKGLETGQIGIRQFVTFAKENYADYAKFSEQLATAPEYAGQRLKIAFEEMQLAIGQSFGISGATIQDTVTGWIKDITAFVTENRESLQQMASDFAGIFQGIVSIVKGAAFLIREALMPVVKFIQGLIRDIRIAVNAAGAAQYKSKISSIDAEIAAAEKTGDVRAAGRIATLKQNREKLVALFKGAGGEAALAGEGFTYGGPGAGMSIDRTPQEKGSSAGKDANGKLKQFDSKRTEILQGRLAAEKAAIDADLLLSERERSIEKGRLDFKYGNQIIDEQLAQARRVSQEYQLQDRASFIAEQEQLGAIERKTLESQFVTSIAPELSQGYQSLLDAYDSLTLEQEALTRGKDELNEAEKAEILLARIRAGLQPAELARVDELAGAYLAQARAVDILSASNQKQLALREALKPLQQQLQLAQILDPRAELRAQIKQERPKLDDEGVEQVARLQEQVNAAQKAKDELQNIASSIGNSFGEAFKGIITGSMTVQQALAGMFQSIADSFADMAAQMIAEYVRMQALGLLKTIFGAVAPALGAGIGAGLSSGFSAGTSSAIDTGAGGWANSLGTSLQFANGGIAPGSFQAFANGGMVTGPTLGLVGEGRYNEAIIPLPDGKSVPVQLSGGAGGNAAPISTNIVVNVKNGQAESQTSGSQGNQLARELEGAVRQVILKESRPGGLISSSR